MRILEYTFQYAEKASYENIRVCRFESGLFEKIGQVRVRLYGRGCVELRNVKHIFNIKLCMAIAYRIYRSPYYHVPKYFFTRHMNP